ncbi:hypothetical protein GQ42DRAFT_110166, partial [Ramicandelaber brevisporus]
IYNRYFHPLRHIPGPFWSSLFPGLKLYDTSLKRAPFHSLELHERYGPVVRYEPDMVSFSEKEAQRTIYSSHSFTKSPLYSSFDIDKVHQTFSTID